MALYDFGIFDYLEDIHFPKPAGTKFPPWVSNPWFFYLLRQQPTQFTFDAPSHVHSGYGWAALPIFSMDIDLDIDTQVAHRIPLVGADSLEAAADRVVETWDQGDPRDAEFFGRMDFSDRFFWKVLGTPFPKWATGLSTRPVSRPNDPNPPIGPYIEKAVTDYFQRWNTDSSAYNAVANGISPSGNGWLPLRQHSFAVPFPPQSLVTFTNLGRAIAREEAWFGPIPSSAWTRILIFFTQSYAFTYGFGQLDPFEWDLSGWPPRRTSRKQIDGGSGKPPSAISGKWGGHDPFQDFIDHQIEFVA